MPISHPNSQNLLGYWTLSEWRDMHHAYRAVADLFFDGNIARARRQVRAACANPLGYWKAHHGKLEDMQ